MDFEFTDKKDRVWVVPELSLWHIEMVKKKTNIALEDLIGDGHLWAAGGESMMLVGSYLWHLCRDQHELEEVDDDKGEETFFRSFDGPVFDSGQKALTERVINFSRPDRGQLLREMKERARVHEIKAREAQAELDKARDLGLEKAIAVFRKTMEEEEIALSNAVTNEREKQEYPTPEDSVYAN